MAVMCKCGSYPHVVTQSWKEYSNSDASVPMLDIGHRWSRGAVFCEDCGASVMGPFRRSAAEAFLAAEDTFKKWLVLRAEGVIRGN